MVERGRLHKIILGKGGMCTRIGRRQLGAQQRQIGLQIIFLVILPIQSAPQMPNIKHPKREFTLEPSLIERGTYVTAGEIAVACPRRYMDICTMYRRTVKYYCAALSPAILEDETRNGSPGIRFLGHEKKRPKPIVR